MMWYNFIIVVLTYTHPRIYPHLQMLAFAFLKHMHSHTSKNTHTQHIQLHYISTSTYTHAEEYRVSARALTCGTADCFRVLLPTGSRRALALVRCQGIGLGRLDAANDAEGIERRRGLALGYGTGAAGRSGSYFRSGGVDFNKIVLIVKEESKSQSTSVLLLERVPMLHHLCHIRVAGSLRRVICVHCVALAHPRPVVRARRFLGHVLGAFLAVQAVKTHVDPVAWYRVGTPVGSGREAAVQPCVRVLGVALLVEPDEDVAVAAAALVMAAESDDEVAFQDDIGVLSCRCNAYWL